MREIEIDCGQRLMNENCDCDCEDWKEGMSQIEAAQIFCAVHSAGPKYTAKPFKYCPWCGKERYQKSQSLLNQVTDSNGVQNDGFT